MKTKRIKRKDKSEQTLKVFQPQHEREYEAYLRSIGKFPEKVEARDNDSIITEDYLDSSKSESSNESSFEEPYEKKDVYYTFEEFTFREGQR